ncbi:MAG: hypothetical protein ABFR82_15585 [Nitrospirota bacterium]
MKEGITNKIITLFTLSVIIMVFVYQCHPVQPESKNPDMHRKPPQVELPEVWEYEKIFKNEELSKLAYLPQTASDAPLVALIGLFLMAMGSLIGLFKLQTGRNGELRSN